MVEKQWYGQKNNTGFYTYTLDRKGRPKKSNNPEVYDLLKGIVKRQVEVTDEQIVHRMMAPMLNESVWCLQENIVDTPMELDLALIYGIGFPPFRGGALKLLDQEGAQSWVSICEPYFELGDCYKPPQLLVDTAKAGKKFYPNL